MDQQYVGWFSNSNVVFDSSFRRPGKTICDTNKFALKALVIVCGPSWYDLKYSSVECLVSYKTKDPTSKSSRKSALREKARL